MILIRKDHLHVRYGLWWMGAAVAFAVLGLFPRIVDYVAVHLGIAYPPVLALMLGLVAVVLKILVMDIERSRNMIRMQRLVQRIALLEAELRDLRANRSESGPESATAEASDLDGEP
jgi:uncharacterized small protein (DUF1192 family)